MNDSPNPNPLCTPGTGAAISVSAILTLGRTTTALSSPALPARLGLPAQTDTGRRLHLTHAMLLSLLLTLPLFLTGMFVWPNYLAIPLFLYGGLCLTFEPLRGSFPRVPLGGIRRHALRDTLAVTALACAIIVLSTAALRVDFSCFRRHVPHCSTSALVLGGVGMALGNAILEELIWRGILFESFTATWGTFLGLLVSALGFGLSHVFFMPNAVLGMTLAFAFGIAVGWLRLRSGGLALPIVAHFCVDVVLIAIILLPTRF